MDHVKSFFNLLSMWGKPVVDFASLWLIIGALLSLLPHLAALAAFVWWLIRIYETKTVQNYLRKRKEAKLLKARTK